MLPNLIVIGGAKCGTSSLHHYLRLHPEIFMSRQKELNFFIHEKNWPRGIAWYEAQFETRRRVNIRGESSPQYTRYPIFRGVPERMHATLPQAKLIYILRDPMERLLSHYIDDVMQNGSRASLAASLHPLECNPFVTSSRQCMQLEQYYLHYPRSQLLLITAEDLAAKRRETLAAAFRFLGVDDSFTSPDFSLKLNPRGIKRDRNWAGKIVEQVVNLRPGRIIPSRLHPAQVLPSRIRFRIRHGLLKAFSHTFETPAIDPALERELLDIFREDVERLRRLTGMKLERWSV